MQPVTTMRSRPRPRAIVWPVSLLHPGLLGAASRLAAPAAVLAAGWSLAHLGRGASAETAYLTLLATGVLAAVAWLTPRPGLDLGIGAMLVVLLLWILPPGPTRGAGVTFLLLALVAIAAARGWAPLLAARRSEGPPSWTALASAAVPTLLALQVLMGARELLGAGLDLATAGRFVVLPVVAAGSIVALARSRGVLPAVIAGAAAVTLGGGAGPRAALALAALAGGAALSAPEGGLSRGFRRPGIAAAAVAGLAVIAPVLWQQRAGAIAVAGGLALAAAPLSSGAVSATASALSGLRKLRAGLPLLPALAVLIGAAWLPLHNWNEAAQRVLWLPVLVPVLILAFRARPLLALCALILALAAGRGTSDLSALGAPAALAAMALSEGRKPRLNGAGGAGLALQGVWSAALLAATALAATYPWLRGEPPRSALETAAGLFGLGATATAALAATALLLTLTAVSRFGAPRRALAAAPLAALALLAMSSLPAAPSTVAHPGGKVLDRNNPELRLELSGQPIRRLVLDSHLAHADGLAAGTRVAVLRLEDEAGRWVEWPLRVARDTGEWAAARSDLVGREDVAVPAPWLSQVVSDEDGAWFFAHLYRSVLALQDPRTGRSTELPRAPDRLILRRDPDLPHKVTLAVFQVETRP